MNVGNFFVSWVTIIELVAAAAFGAAIASLIWSRRARQTRQDFSFSMRKRAAQAEKLRDQFSELNERLRHHDEQVAELATARRDLASLRVELEHAHATLDDAQRALEAARSDVADVDERFGSQLETERLESAERRHHVESELTAARDALLALQDEVAGIRTNAQRTIDRLETDLDATRAMLNHSSDALRGEREAAAAMREELRAQIGTADWDRQRAEAELQQERAQWAEKLAATQPYVAQMREQYLLAAAERDAMVKELTMQRERGEENARAVERTREEFTKALDEEHRTAMELLNRAWSYVQTFPRVPETWPRPTARTARVPDDMPDPSAGRRATSSPAPFADMETRMDVELSADRAPAHAPAPESAGPPPSTPERPSEYDIEAELADAIAEDLDGRSFTRTRKPRKPIGTVKIGNESVVVCDDGSAWRKGERGWRQVTPVPGTPVLSRDSKIERAG